MMKRKYLGGGSWLMTQSHHPICQTCRWFCYGSGRCGCQWNWHSGRQTLQQTVVWCCSAHITDAVSQVRGCIRRRLDLKSNCMKVARLGCPMTLKCGRQICSSIAEKWRLQRRDPSWPNLSQDPFCFSDQLAFQDVMALRKWQDVQSLSIILHLNQGAIKPACRVQL